MKISKSNKGLKTLQSFSSWQTVNEEETLIEFEPMGNKEGNFLHINSTHRGIDGKRRKSYFVHVLTRQDAVMLRDFLDEMLAVKEGEEDVENSDDVPEPAIAAP